MLLDAFVAQLSVLVCDALNEHQSATPSALCSVQVPFDAKDPARVIRCIRNDASYYILVSKHVGNIAGITTVQLVLPTPIPTDRLASAYETALTDAINKTPSERVIGRDLYVQMDKIGAGNASTIIAGIIARPVEAIK